MKTIVTIIALCLCALCGAQAQSLRDNYRFEASLDLPTDDGRFAGIIVQGFVDDDESPAFECVHELVEWAEPDEMTESRLHTYLDINFDGHNDLVIYLGFNAMGRVAEYYAAYVWNPQGHVYEEVEGYDGLANPEPNPDSQTITSIERTNINEITTRTYAWNGGKLELVKEEKEKIYDEEE